MKNICWEIIFGIISIIIVIGTVVWLCIFAQRWWETDVWEMTWYWWALLVAGGVSGFYLMIGAPCEHTNWE